MQRERGNSAPTAIGSLPRCSIFILFLSFDFLYLFFCFRVPFQRPPWLTRRTSAGVAVPATTLIKISRPDVNHRLESSKKRGGGRRKKVKDTHVGNESIRMYEKKKRKTSRGRNDNRNAKEIPGDDLKTVFGIE